MQILPESDIRWRRSQRTYQIHFKDSRNLTRFTSYLRLFLRYRHVLYLCRKLKTFCKQFTLCKFCLRVILDEEGAIELTKFTLKTQEIFPVSHHISGHFWATDMYCTSSESLKHFKKTLFYVKYEKNWYLRCYGPGKMPYSNFIRGASSWKLKYPKNQV